MLLLLRQRIFSLYWTRSLRVPPKCVALTTQGFGSFEHDGLRLAAHHGSIPVETPLLEISRDSGPGRAVVDRDVVHIEDLLAVAAERIS